MIYHWMRLKSHVEHVCFIIEHKNKTIIEVKYQLRQPVDTEKRKYQVDVDFTYEVLDR